MKLVSAIDVMQDCSLFWMESEPSFGQFLQKNKLGMFLLFRQVDIERLPVYGEQISAETRIYKCKGFYGYRNTFLYGEDGRPCVKSWGVGAFVGFESGRMARLPQEEIDKVTIEPELEMEYLDKRIALPEVEFRELPRMAVRKGDIDLNGHVNNARYLEAAVELLSAPRPIGRIRVEYKAPAKLDDVFYPELAELDDRTYLTLSNKDKVPYAVMEFCYQ